MRIAVSSDGKTLAQTKIVPTPRDFEEGINTFKQVADELTQGEKIEMLAGGVAGPLDKEKTMLIASPHIGGWINKPFKKSLEEIFNAPLFFEHEADLEGLGETAFGAGKGYNIVATIILGTGVASTRTVEGQIDKNSLGFEAGHHIIVPEGRPCDCGGAGHFESYVSGSGIYKGYGKKGEDIKDPKIWDEVAKYLSLGLNNVAVFWSPDVIVLGGAVMKSIPLETVKSYYKQVVTVFPFPPEILPAKLGDSAAFYGALQLINQSKLS